MNTSLPDEEMVQIPVLPSPRPRVRWHGRLSVWMGLVAVTGLLMLFLVPVVRSSIETTRRDRCLGNLGQIALAMHNYEAQHGHFPAPELLGRNGGPVLSWRVALLPDLGHDALYRRFHLDEPWDSPHNLALLPEMPAVFICPSAPASRHTRTGYIVLVGPKTGATSVNTPFEPTRGVDIREITDGTSNTILVLETNLVIPWTKPEDRPWTPDGPLPDLASPHSGGTNATFCDGSKRFLKATIPPPTLRSILTINGGEVVNA
jgi:prepilin-type processing-associated H-X9-DG protein